MGYEELNVIDPTTGKPVKAETDMSDVRVCLRSSDRSIDQCVSVPGGGILIVYVYYCNAATSKGFYRLQKVSGQGYYESCDSSRVDHAAIYDASEYGRDYGVY